MSVCLTKTTHSLKRIFVWMILVACLSSLVTYHIGLLLPWVEISQSVGQVQRQLRMTNENLGRPLANPKLNQHPYRKLTQASDHQNQNSQISHIFAKLKQVGSYRFLNLFWLKMTFCINNKEQGQRIYDKKTYNLKQVKIWTTLLYMYIVLPISSALINMNLHNC